MKLHPLILRDHYRRWWWAHLVVFLLFAAIGVQVGHGLDPHWIPLGAGALLGAVTLAAELNGRTNARTLLSFPVRASELGTTWWWIAVPLSALAPTAGLAVGWTVSGLFGSTAPVGIAALLRFLLLTQAVSAFQFTVLCFMPNADTSNPREKILGGFTGAFWGIGLSASCSFTMFWANAHTVWDPLSCAILAMGAVCGLVSWHRRTAFMLQRARKNEGPTQSGSSLVILPQPSRLDGFAGLYIQTMFHMAGIGLAISAVVGGILAWSGDMASMRIRESWVIFGLHPGVMLITVCLGSLRHWRALPISAERMSWVMIRLLLTGCCAWMLPLIATDWLVGQPLGWSNLGSMVFAGGLFAFALRFGMKRFMLLLLLVLVAQVKLSPILGRFFEQGGEHPATAASALTGVILLFVAQAWIVRSLRHQSRIFSPGFHQFGRLNTSA
jgi:hypothetical protein